MAVYISIPIPPITLLKGLSQNIIKENILTKFPQTNY